MKEQQRYNKIEAYLLNIIVVLLPFLVVGFILFLNGYKLRFSILLPAWNDEVGWWNQVNTMIQYGKPFGYYGYNGTHAAIGKWAAWGVLRFCLIFCLEKFLDGIYILWLWLI